MAKWINHTHTHTHRHTHTSSLVATVRSLTMPSFSSCSPKMATKGMPDSSQCCSWLSSLGFFLYIASACTHTYFRYSHSSFFFFYPVTNKTNIPWFQRSTALSQVSASLPVNSSVPKPPWPGFLWCAPSLSGKAVHWVMRVSHSRTTA